LSFDLNDTIWAEGRRWYIDEITYNTKEGYAKATLRSKEPIKDRVTITDIGGGGKVEFSDTPDSFVRSIANAGPRVNSTYYQQNPKSITLNNKLLYTQIKTRIQEAQDVLLWGES